MASEEVILVAAFIVEEVRAVHDPAQLAVYRDQITAVLAAADGATRVALTDPVTTLEGAWRPAGIGITEFADLAQARAWWASPALSALQQLRRAVAHFNTLLVCRDLRTSLERAPDRRPSR
jgi:uncharacterized protein (DUF1330 family)